jgi:hypothetical protein
MTNDDPHQLSLIVPTYLDQLDRNNSPVKILPLLPLTDERNW